MLTPSLIYHAQMLKLLGRYGQPRQVDVHGIVHVTGGGLDGNAARVVRNGLKVNGQTFGLLMNPCSSL